MKRNYIIIAVFVFVGVVKLLYEYAWKPLANHPTNNIPASDSTRSLWYKNSIIYNVDAKVFKDSDGDGIGDFTGLTQRLGYIDSLGANVIWLSPFMVSPKLDDGYDIEDYYKVDKSIGSLNDFTTFIQKAHSLKMKVIIDLVINHTSDQHPWFKAASKSDQSPFHSWYVWSKEKPSNFNKGMVFPGVQVSIWDYDSALHEYYYHRFYKFQPDLNIQNPAVWKEVKKIITFWLDKGVDGFRVDGVPFVIEVPQTKGDDFPHELWRLKDLHHFVDSIKPSAIILGEANILPNENQKYFGETGEGMHMMFNFYVNQHLFYALATGDVNPLRSSLEKTRALPVTAAWGQFLRNHDEVDLGRLSNKERDKVFKQMGPAKNMQLYNRGIRRRLAPMLNDNLQNLELAYSMLLALPSTPVIRYGDEIGMGDDLSLKERLSVRTPMQWNSKFNGGFTTSKNPIRPIVSSGLFNYKEVNTLTESAKKSSLYNWTKMMIRLRKLCPEIGEGDWKILEASSDHVLVLGYKLKNDQLITIHNFSDRPQVVKISDNDFKNKKLFNLIDSSFVPALKGGYLIDLAAHDFKWLKVR